ncbi:MAG TPA: hypothetical protein VFJ47_04755 [Terriglobales bacterium]|nr:hypothetical protein [Terriglobales bacterium]
MTRNPAVLRCILVCLVALDLFPTASQAQDSTGIVIVLDVANQKASYKVNSQSVAYRDLLDHLSEQKRKWPAAAPRVTLLASEDATLAQIDAVRGIIVKAGYEWPRVYYFGKNKRLMIELTYSRGIPFSDHDFPAKK